MSTIIDDRTHSVAQSPDVADQPRSITFTARGIPGAQGSKSFKGFTGAGHAILAESSKKVAPWRQDVVASAIAAIRDAPGFRPFDGPVHLIIEFYLARPKGDPKTRRTVPSKTPDLSKLIRSTEDAMTTAGIWRDDALVVDMTIRKRYVLLDPTLGHRFELPGQGARITVVEIDPEDTWSDTPLELDAHDRFRPAQVPTRIAPAVTTRGDRDGAVIVSENASTGQQVKLVEKATSKQLPLAFDARPNHLASVPGKPLNALQEAVAAYVHSVPDGERLRPVVFR